MSTKELARAEVRKKEFIRQVGNGINRQWLRFRIKNREVLLTDKSQSHSGENKVDFL